MFLKNFILSVLILTSFCCFSQKDTTQVGKKKNKITSNRIYNPLSPSKAAFYSAIIPGLGQVYIGKPWKVPIVYAAIGASLYYYDLNNKEMIK